MKNCAILLVFVFVCLYTLACASQSTVETAPISSPSPVLEPEDSAAAETPIEAPSAPSLSPLQVRLAELGYQGVGIELESEDVLAFLLKVFSDRSAAGRKIRSVYTGGTHAYDAASESLTLGGSRDVKASLTFIKKKVPIRPKRKG